MLNKEENTFAYTAGTEDEIVFTTLIAKADSVDGNEVMLSAGSNMGGISEKTQEKVMVSLGAAR